MQPLSQDLAIIPVFSGSPKDASSSDNRKKQSGEHFSSSVVTYLGRKEDPEARRAREKQGERKRNHCRSPLELGCWKEKYFSHK
ncbi:hypothetical protein ACRRTK_022632 [Alexandromys fortis]